MLGLNPELRRTIELEFSKESEDKKTLLNYAERARQIDSIIVKTERPSRKQSVYELANNDKEMIRNTMINGQTQFNRDRYKPFRPKSHARDSVRNQQNFRNRQSSYRGTSPARNGFSNNYRQNQSFRGDRNTMQFNQRPNYNRNNFNRNNFNRNNYGNQRPNFRNNYESQFRPKQDYEKFKMRNVINAVQVMIITNEIG